MKESKEGGGEGMGIVTLVKLFLFFFCIDTTTNAFFHFTEGGVIIREGRVLSVVVECSSQP